MKTERTNNFLAQYGSDEHIQKSLESDDFDSDTVPSALLNPCFHKGHSDYIATAKYKQYNRFSDNDIKNSKKHISEN